MTLTGRFFALYGITQLLGLIGVVYAPMTGVALTLGVTLLVLALMDRRTLADQTDFEVTLSPPRNAVLGSESELKIRVQAKTRRALQQSSVTALAPEIEVAKFLVTENKFRLSELIDGIYSGSFPFQVQKLGYVNLKSWPFTALSRFGLFRRTFLTPTEEVEFRISPEEKKLNEQAFFEMLQTQRVIDQGSRLRTQARSADLFRGIRKYHYPDSIRHLDHKKSARYQEPMTRVFEEDRSHHLILAIDSGRAMAGDVRGSRKADYYLSAALALAENAVASRDQVSLFSFSKDLRGQIRKSRTLAPFKALYRSSSEFSPREEESDFTLLPRAISNLAGSRAIVVILTDLTKPSVQDALLYSLGDICRKHLTVALSLNDRENDLDMNVLSFPQELVGEEFREKYSDLLYSYWSKEKQSLFRERFARLGGGSLVLNDADWISSVKKLYGLLRTSRLS